MGEFKAMKEIKNQWMGGDLNSLKIEEKSKIYLSMSKESEEICI